MTVVIADIIPYQDYSTIPAKSTAKFTVQQMHVKMYIKIITWMGFT